MSADQPRPQTEDLTSANYLQVWLRSTRSSIDHQLQVKIGGTSSVGIFAQSACVSEHPELTYAPARQYESVFLQDLDDGD